MRSAQYHPRRPRAAGRRSFRASEVRRALWRTSSAQSSRWSFRWLSQRSRSACLRRARPESRTPARARGSSRRSGTRRPGLLDVAERQSRGRRGSPTAGLPHPRRVEQRRAARQWDELAVRRRVTAAVRAELARDEHLASGEPVHERRLPDARQAEQRPGSVRVRGTARAPRRRRRWKALSTTIGTPKATASIASASSAGSCARSALVSTITGAAPLSQSGREVPLHPAQVQVVAERADEEDSVDVHATTCSAVRRRLLPLEGGAARRDGLDEGLPLARQRTRSRSRRPPAAPPRGAGRRERLDRALRGEEHAGSRGGGRRRAPERVHLRCAAPNASSQDASQPSSARVKRGPPESGRKGVAGAQGRRSGALGRELRGSAENRLRHMSEPPFARRSVPRASRGRRHRRPSRVRTGRARSGRRETRVCPSVCRSCADSSTGGPDRRRGYAESGARAATGAVAEKPGSVPTCRSFVTIRPQRGRWEARSAARVARQSAAQKAYAAASLVALAITSRRATGRPSRHGPRRSITPKASPARRPAARRLPEEGHGAGEEAAVGEAGGEDGRGGDQAPPRSAPGPPRRLRTRPGRPRSAGASRAVEDTPDEGSWERPRGRSARTRPRSPRPLQPRSSSASGAGTASTPKAWTGAPSARCRPGTAARGQPTERADALRLGGGVLLPERPQQHGEHRGRRSRERGPVTDPPRDGAEHRAEQRAEDRRPERGADHLAPAAPRRPGDEPGRLARPR